MRKFASWAALTALCLCATPMIASAKDANKASDAASSPDAALATPQKSVSSGSVTVEGKRIQYTAVAGTIVLHGKGDDENTPTASLFYVAYFKKGADPSKRPVTFLYNGGPGSASVWLHMGAFGPRRVQTSDHTHTPAAPYKLVNNDYSLLDASDLVFIDAPGTGFSRLIAQTGKDKRDALMKKRAKQFYSVDGDGQAFAQFVTRFLSTYGRWNSPKYLFGESYGTTRSAVLSNILENQDSVDLNGVVLLSQILSFDNSPDSPSDNPGVDQPYVLALPTYAATAWYHHKLPQPPADLPTLMKQVESFATGEYSQALAAGSMLDPARKQAVAEKLHQYTGLPVAYLVKADLRVSGPMFEHELLSKEGDSTGRLDTRFAGPSMDPMSKTIQYDPQSSAISSAYVATFNNYVRKTLKFGQDKHYRLFAGFDHWDFTHDHNQQSLNVMTDLAEAMKANPDLKVMMNGGYYDMATPFFAAEYELDHLPIPQRLHKNISVHLYQSGHMVYAHLPSLKKLHDNVAAFIRSTDHG
ncbi:S10 family peptidase [Oleiagrimonas citrea]|jgi:carboxypeptidase C (cathepsin A)|uniref:Peptidase S10 n=1 Tax=Oleiagrimonas citrea TaxID=1665687 RepID=A0A846ZQC4_9GAMM|nr:peptidase S10 [Oleiagrimonas citrea]NKZ39780.1 peptidase S10 [Oleiagrimonas citrea]